MVEGKIALCEVEIRKDIVWLKSQRPVSFFDRFPILPQRCIIGSQVRVWRKVSWIGLFPHLVRLNFLQEVAIDDASIVGGDDKFFSLAYTIPQFESLPNILDREAALPKVVVRHSQAAVGHRKIGVELNGALQEWNAFRVSLFIQDLRAQAEGLQCFKGRSRCLPEWRV